MSKLIYAEIKIGGELTSIMMVNNLIDSLNCYPLTAPRDFERMTLLQDHKRVILTTIEQHKPLYVSCNLIRGGILLLPRNLFRNMIH